MSAVTFTQAQDKGLRHQLAALSETVLDFCGKLYAAHGGMRGMRAPVVLGNSKRPEQVLALADRFEAYAPSLAAELRQIASRG